MTSIDPPSGPQPDRCDGWSPDNLVGNTINNMDTISMSANGGCSMLLPWAPGCAGHATGLTKRVKKRKLS